MSSGLSPADPTLEAAFRSALIHQGLLAAAIVAGVLLLWGTSRNYVPAIPAASAAAEPAARRVLRIGFGLLWALDAVLQAQPQMPGGLPSLVIQPAAESSPGWVRGLVNAGGTVWSNHPVQAAAAAVWIQAGIGLWLLVAVRGRWSRAAGIASVAWGLVVWILGESFGATLAPGLSWLTGAPGAALLYCVAGALVALPLAAWHGRRAGRALLAGSGAFLFAMAVLQAWPGRGSWQGGSGGALPTAVRAASKVPQPRPTASITAAFGSFDAAHGFAVNLVAVLALAAIGAALVAASGAVAALGPITARVARARLGAGEPGSDAPHPAGSRPGRGGFGRRGADGSGADGSSAGGLGPGRPAAGELGPGDLGVGGADGPGPGQPGSGQPDRGGFGFGRPGLAGLGVASAGSGEPGPDGRRAGGSRARLARWRERLTLGAVAAACALCLADWILVQDLGFLGGVGTDPNSMIPAIILLVSGYLGAARPPAALPVAPAATEAARVPGDSGSPITAARANAAGATAPATTTLPGAPLPGPVAPSLVPASAGLSATGLCATAAGDAVPPGAGGGRLPWAERVRGAVASMTAGTAAALGALAVVLIGVAPMATAAANGTADPILAEAISGYSPPIDSPAPGFQLTDAGGHAVSLASLRGKVVLLTFLDPVCTTDCPLIARELKLARQQLGSQASQVEMVAVAANLTYYGPQFTEAFDEQEELAGMPGWAFLTGSLPRLRAIWKQYGVDVENLPAGAMSAHNDLAILIGRDGSISQEIDIEPGPGTASTQSSFGVLLAADVRAELSRP
jgi:cytochrome oxidase Cu insertion factor (SCO1/SenC/PrrC family)